MEKALRAFANALVEAVEAERIGGGGEGQDDGGSAHGSTEVLYRLHASRLKCLIAAVNRGLQEREAAELEALRLTECHWHNKPEKLPDSTAIRDRIWTVLADVVAALAQCRIDKPFFHRSVYRHAQALMWAPVLFDPVGGRVDGSFGTVPATCAAKIRGLNHSTNAATSAAVIMGSLFEKKRSQLCAVWVSAAITGSAFQILNSFSRKYDSLRSKYISAYIDSLRLCYKKDSLETFLRLTFTCPRDPPSYFAASAVVMGGVPKEAHTRDCLLVKKRSLSSFHFLTTVKREANSALASVICHGLGTNAASTGVKVLENLLKSAYACFMRLNCDVKEPTRSQAFKLLRRSAGAKEVVEALTAAYLRVSKDPPLPSQRSDWSGEAQFAELLEASLKKSKELFPSLSGNFFSNVKKKPQKSRKKGQSKEGPGEDKGTRSFEVAVPEGLEAGDTFLAQIEVNGASKTLRLTVPAGRPSSLRFQMSVPENDELEQAKVSSKTDNDK